MKVENTRCLSVNCRLSTYDTVLGDVIASWKTSLMLCYDGGSRRERISLNTSCKS